MAVDVSELEADQQIEQQPDPVAPSNEDAIGNALKGIVRARASIPDPDAPSSRTRQTQTTPESEDDDETVTASADEASSADDESNTDTSTAKPLSDAARRRANQAQRHQDELDKLTAQVAERDTKLADLAKRVPPADVAEQHQQTVMAATTFVLDMQKAAEITSIEIGDATRFAGLKLKRDDPNQYLDADEEDEYLRLFNGRQKLGALVAARNNVVAQTLVARARTLTEGDDALPGLDAEKINATPDFADLVRYGYETGATETERRYEERIASLEAKLEQATTRKVAELPRSGPDGGRSTVGAHRAASGRPQRSVNDRDPFQKMADGLQEIEAQRRKASSVRRG